MFSNIYSLIRSIHYCMQAKLQLLQDKPNGEDNLRTHADVADLDIYIGSISSK